MSLYQNMSQKVFQGGSYTLGVVPGPYREERMVCEYPHMNNAHNSLFGGLNPLSYATPVLFMQFILIFIVSRTLYFFLKPLRQSIMTAQIITGIILGPSFLAQNINYAKRVLPLGGKSILSTAADVGMVIHLFLLGVQADTTVLRKSGKNSLIISISGFVFAYVLSALAMFTSMKMIKLDKELLEVLPFIVSLGSISSFPVVTSLLADLNILNSELGQLSSFVAMINDCLCFLIAVVVGHTVTAVTTNDYTQLWSITGVLIYLVSIAFIFRPLIIWIGRRIPQGKIMGEAQLIPILSIVLGCAFTSEFIGYHAGLGSFVLGLAVPDGPPLGENLIYKLEVMSSGLFLPAKFGISGLNANILSIKNNKFAIVVESIIVFGYLGKFLGTVASALFCELRFKEAVSIGLVMCCKGIVDIALFCLWKDTGLLGELEYALLIITMLIMTGIARPLVVYLYDPSRRYKVHVRSSLLEYHRRNVQPRILISIHREENVTTILQVLEASNPTKSSRLSVFVLNLKELKGRATSILVPNFNRGSLTSTLKHSEHIMNAFSYYEDHQSQGNVLLQHFTAIAPYSSMHDDICNLALDKRVTIVILPFHKQWDIDGKVGAVFPLIRMVNRNVLNKAPCTVGVLVDRKHVGGPGWAPLTAKTTFRVALLFLEGTDDREAFAYATRMADHPRVALTVVWIRPSGKKIKIHESREKIDTELMEEYKAKAKGNDRVVFREVFAEDVVGTTRVIHSLEDIGFDLFIVGRYHEPSSPLVLGMSEWSDCPELGAIGDMLSTSDFTFSVLVIQQQPMGDIYLDRSYHRAKIFQDPGDMDGHDGHVV